MAIRVLILTAHTGGGHDSVALASQQALADCPVRVRAVQAAPLGSGIDVAYGLAIGYAPALWGACYRLTDQTHIRVVGSRVLAARYGARLAALIDHEAPDLILSVHALCAQLAAVILRRHKLSVLHHCVVTDLIRVHRTWLTSAIDAYYVPTAYARLALIEGGIPMDRIVLSGMPLRQAFWSGPGPLPSTQQSGRLRLLLLDGGQPGPSLLRALDTLLHVGLPLEIRLAWGATSVPTGAPRGEVGQCHVHHLPVGSSIAAEMADADLIVSKAGSVTIAEALAVGRPILMFRALPGQERGNPSYVESIGAGLVVPTPEMLTEAVHHFAAAPTMRHSMAERAAQAGKPDAAKRVVAHLLTSLDKRTGSWAAN